MKKLHKNSSLLPIIAVVVMSLFTLGTTHAQIDVMTIKGASVTVKGSTLVDKAPDTKPNIFVGGDVTNDAGTVDNDGEFQFTGNYLLNNGATHTSTGDDITIGGNGTPDATYNKLLQTITGTNTSALSGTYGFNNLIIQKPSWTTINDSRIRLGMNIDVKNSLIWTGSGGIISTDLTSHADDGSTYSYFINLKNGDPTSLSGYASVTSTLFGNTGSGATTAYIEGKLKWLINQSGTYYFPIGVSPISLDGMEPVAITFSSTPTSNSLLAYLQPAATISYLTDLITDGGTLFYDVGSLPAISPMNQFQNCVGTPDGHDDIAVIDQATGYEWIITPDNPATFTYELRVYPGSTLDNLSYVPLGAACNSLFTSAKYFSWNGRIGGQEAVGPTVNYWNPGVNGLYDQLETD